MIPQRHQSQSPSPSLEPVFELAQEYNQSLLLKDISTVHMWLNEGCDLNLDILPTMKEIIKRRSQQGRGKIETFSYFTVPIRAARDKRTAERIVQKANTPITDEARARNYAWKRSRGMWLGDGEERFLEEYEKQNGRVDI